MQTQTDPLFCLKILSASLTKVIVFKCQFYTQLYIQSITIFNAIIDFSIPIFLFF